MQGFTTVRWEESDFMEQAERHCILCGSPNRAPLFKQADWHIYRCTGCGLGLLDPRPGKTELEELYRQSYFDSHYDGGLKAASPEMRRRLSQETHRLRFFRDLKRKGRLLDMGCGMGYFLYAARNAGYDVEGMDVSDASAAYVREELKIKVTTGDISEVNYEGGTFDVITMWHFLEHAPDPGTYLEKAAHWLADGGLLVVDVPNYEGTDAQKTWVNWTGWSLPYHLYHFTPQTLRTILIKYGFTPIRTKSYLSEYIKEALEKVAVARPFARIIARCFSGHSIAMVARKKKR